MIDRRILDSYEPTIGIECHVQLKTKTKLFSGADNNARGKAPNSVGLVTPICFGLPGALPVLNRRAVELATRAGIALNAEVAPISTFDRKHYFYPDLPMGYQITQLERPIIGKGAVDVQLAGQVFTVRIHHAHLEADAGKLTHPAGADYSLVDLNRAGTPLIEIVSEPDMHSAAQARAFVRELHLLMRYADVTYGDLYQGNMRFDVNISVAQKGADQWGTRAEIKNLNSFRSVEKVVEHEFTRQVELLESGQKILQETRGWDDAKQKTFSQRSKEDAHDYRYFPDADLPPVEVTSDQMTAAARAVKPLLPWTIRQNLAAEGISLETANTLLDHPDIIARCQQLHGMVSGDILRTIVNLLVNTELKHRKGADEEGGSKDAWVPDAPQLIALATLYQSKKIGSTAATELYDLLRTRRDATLDLVALAEQEGKLQVSDTAEIEAIVDTVLADPAAAQPLADLRAGRDKAIGFLVGMVMKQSRGKANPALASELIRKKL